jgi:UDPglucose 6-dehydrogenase
MKVTVIGTGYVGLVSGTCLAEIGHEVTAIDRDQSRIARLQGGQIPIFEPGLEELVVKHRGAGNLKFSCDAGSIAEADVVLIAVGTPSAVDGSADCSALWSVARDFGAMASRETVWVIKSTVPVGTNSAFLERLDQVIAGKHHVVSNPEFLREGSAIDDFMCPDRIVIGVRDEHSRDVMNQLYEPLTQQGYTLLEMAPESAELTKYASNAFLAIKISFINEVANLCEAASANVTDVGLGVGLDTRIGSQFLRPGVGYGGSCFPKDTRALVSTSNDHGCPATVVAAADQANELQKQRLGNQIANYFAGDLSGKRIALWGLAFKPDTDDIREAPSLVLIDRLLSAGATVIVYDPEAMDHVRGLFGGRLQYADNALDAIDGADALAIVTEWREFYGIDLGTISSRLGRPVIFDGRNVYDPIRAAEFGCTYFSIGRPPIVLTQSGENHATADSLGRAG